MTERGNALIGLTLVVALIALVLSIMAYATRNRPEARQAPRTPATLDLSMVVATFSGQGMAAHRWYPTMLVARRGDTIDLAVANPDQFNHQLEITGYNLKTKKLTPGSSDSIRFVADHSGVFLFQCVLPHNPATGDCTPDHPQMRGFLIVTE